MNHTIILIILVSLLTPALAQEVDFSKAYVIIPETSPSIEEEKQRVRIGGVKTVETRDDEVTVFNWTLSLDFDPENASFHLLEAQLQEEESIILQQRLRGTIWKGDYRTVNNLYLTELRFKSVQEGFVGGEIIHTTSEQPEPSSFLHAKVAGDITTQYFINEEREIDEENELIWVDVDKYKEIVNSVQEKNEGKEEDEIVPIPPILETRHLIRLKRTRPIGKLIHATGHWGSHNEYRLTLEQDRLVGSVGTPANSYGVKDVLTGNGELELRMFIEPAEPAPEQILE
ncbi:hypothetical protein QUF54_04675 [Candidatus Marithioploca araucensis]|uniref:Uncharacterized protein n=1 Tax=Candidatus Marithioploca araucensis TaxID=70273 RepID=A0ABT7VSU3_9GAMM|nr:hypothetical protein [Thiotrichales bacterium HSG14]MDM8562630.1 hypothetical protein [Candidatus Marithioploca araucensis]